MSDRNTRKAQDFKERRQHFVRLEQRALFLLKVLLIVIAIFVVADWILPFLRFL